MQKHFWEYEVFEPRSRWFFITPSSFAKSLQLYVLELGHFFQDGRCYTERRPENSFSINFSPAKSKNNATVVRQFPDERYEFHDDGRKGSLALVDNHAGCTIEQYGKHEGYFIQFGGFLAEQCCRLLLSGNHCRILYTEHLPEIISSFEKLVEMYRQPANDRKDTCAAMLMTQILAQLTEDSTDDIHIAKNIYIKRALEIIEQEFPGNLSLQTLAARLHINPSYLSRLFKKETGTSFSSCLSHVRLNHAKKLLQTSNLSMDEIAAHCGFCNASHFIQCFHKAETITPLQYRIARK